MLIEKLKYGFLGFGGFIIMISCNQTEEPADIGRSYFPDDIGRFYIYQVDSVYVDCNFSIRDTFHYQVKEYYESTYLDNMGDTAIRLEIYKRTDSTAQWQLTDIWNAKVLPTRIEKVEENNRFVKLTFPIIEGEEWDGNEYNFLDPWYYSYGAVDVPFNNGFMDYDSTVLVTQFSDQLPPTPNIIEMNVFTETYARNVGMIQKVKINFDALTVNNPPCGPLPVLPWNLNPVTERIDKGYLVTYTLIDYGFE